MDELQVWSKTRDVLAIKLQPLVAIESYYPMG
jgi:hypothetical protein